MTGKRQNPSPVYVYVTSINRILACADSESAAALILLDVLNTRKRREAQNSAKTGKNNSQKDDFNRDAKGRFATKGQTGGAAADEPTPHRNKVAKHERLSETENIKLGEDNIQKCLDSQQDIEKGMQWGNEWVAFLYGNQGTEENQYSDGCGLSKIAAKHPDALRVIPEAIAKSTDISYQIENGQQRICIKYLGYEVILDRVFRDSKGNTKEILWVVTGFLRIKRYIKKPRWT